MYVQRIFFIFGGVCELQLLLDVHEFLVIRKAVQHDPGSVVEGEGEGEGEGDHRATSVWVEDRRHMKQLLVMGSSVVLVHLAVGIHNHIPHVIPKPTSSK